MGGVKLKKNATHASCSQGKEKTTIQPKPTLTQHTTHNTQQAAAAAAAAAANHTQTHTRTTCKWFEREQWVKIDCWLQCRLRRGHGRRIVSRLIVALWRKKIKSNGNCFIPLCVCVCVCVCT